MIRHARAADAWRALGATDPYFAVLTDPRFREADRPGPARDAFFQSGEDDIARLFEEVALEYPDFAPRRALDFGCGVGRLLLPLARRVPEVVGADVSRAMLAEAQHNTAQARLGNITLIASDAAGYRQSGTFDLVHSCIVFQHIPRRTGMTIVRDLVDRLNPDGVAALHFVYAIRKPRWWRIGHWARKTIPGAHGTANLLRGRSVTSPLMQMNAYSLAEIYATIYDCGARRVSGWLTDHDGFLGTMLIFRKPPDSPRALAPSDHGTSR
jgi:SAM-dependent methyltransferase